VIDLNLIRAFVAIYETGGISAAADRLHVSQPSVSYTLKRLRDLLGEPLFTRTREGMVPTFFATQLYEKFRKAVSEIEGTIESTRKFDPHLSGRRFRLAMSDIGEKEKLVKLEEEVKRLAAIEKALLASPDKQISLTDPDCRSMATSGRGSGMVAYNVQSAVDTTNHLIVAHEVTNVGTDRSQLATMAQAAKAALYSDNLDVVADRGYFKGEEILACEQAGIMVTLPKPQTSGAKSAGRFGKSDFVYLAKDDVYRCPAGEKLAHHFTADEDGQEMRIYLTKACRICPFKDQCTTSNERRIKRWEHESVVEAAQTRLDQNPQAMRVRRETAEHPFATLKMRMGATHFLTKRLPNVATEMALNVLAYNLTRVMNIVGIKPLLVAIRA
jgi:molybdenum-dependent DNA-binding transcriptional regulator ModE